MSGQWSKEGFDWNTLKRDQLLMTPLFDLRQNPTAPSEAKELLKFYDDKQRNDYPEAFKQKFFSMRKDIRLFAAGGAFEGVSKIPELKDYAKLVFAKKPLPKDGQLAIAAKSQDIRFVMFYAITREKLFYQYSYSSPNKDNPCARKTYRAVREFDVELAIWDALNNETVWIGTKNLSPTNSRSYSVNPTFYERQKLKKQGVKPRNCRLSDRDGSSSLGRELVRNKGRFPGFEKREPSFTSSFDDFALAFPIHPSEEKLIVYSNFTYHRFEFGLPFNTVGDSLMIGGDLGFSSIINNRYRFGGNLMFGGLGNVTFQARDYSIGFAGLAGTARLEYVLSRKSRLLFGTYLGMGSFDVTDEELAEQERFDAIEQKGSEATETDFVLYAWPHASILFGKRAGFQYGLTGGYRYFHGIENEVLDEHKPSPWFVSLNLAYTWRGF